MSAVFIGQPLARLLAIVKVKHAAYRVHPDAVYVVFLHEVYGIGYEEAPDLILLVVEQHSTPLGLLAPAGIRMLVKGGAVKAAQALCVTGKVGGYPVHYYAYACLVEAVHQLLELGGGAVAGGYCVIARYLIAPAVVQGIFGYRHKLNMGIAHGGNVFYQTLCQRRKIQPLHPAAKVHLVYAHGRGAMVLVGQLFHVGGILPLVAVIKVPYL